MYFHVKKNRKKNRKFGAAKTGSGVGIFTFDCCETVLTDCRSLTMRSSTIFPRSADASMSFVLLTLQNYLDKHIHAKSSDERVRCFGDILVPLSRKNKLNI